MMGDTENKLLEYVVFAFAVFGLLNTVVSIVYKQIKPFSLPKLWKYSYISIDFGHIFLSIGLILSISFKRTGSEPICNCAGFFVLFGVFDCVCGFLTAGIILFGIYNPGKSTQISKFHRNVFLVIVVPQKIISALLSALPFLPIGYFENTTSYAITCVKIAQSNEDGSALGIIKFCVLWISLFIGLITCIVSAIKLRKNFSNRIHSSSINVWQSQLVIQGKAFQKFLISQLLVWIVVLFIFNFATYYNGGEPKEATWIVLIDLSLASSIHGVFTNAGNIMWSICCCGSAREVEEPRHKLKRLELIQIEEPGKLRLRATWSIPRAVLKRGLMKVYGPNHVKAWAQEIVVLGMLRKAQHPSLLQCLWTSSSNPYYETMTLITGEIITSDSRIICFELTNNGSLHEMLQRDVSLPEACQRMVVHDVAEGLFYLHSQNILHNNLNSSCIYLKGSLPNMVMRAAIGDFDCTQIYGSLQHSEPTITNKRQFFLPDIRSFALVALEIVTKSCERRFLSMQYEWDYDEDPNELINKNRSIVPIPSFSPTKSHQSIEISKSFVVNHTSEEEEMLERRLPDGIRSPYEMIEEVARRSRSMSPGSRPMSEQSKRSTRSRTMSPDLRRSQNNSPSARTLYTGHCGTPEPDNTKANQNTNFSHEIFSKRKKSPDIVPTRTMSPFEKKKEKLKKTKSNSKEEQAFELQQPKDKSLKKTNSKKMLSKPVSIIKNLTGSETTVTAFKPNNKGDSSAEEISDEEIEHSFNRYKLSRKMRQDSNNSIQSANSLHRTISQKSDQWSIRSDMEYRPHGLKNTVSADSRSSLWSNLPLPLESIDVDRDELDDVIDCLPGMTDSFDAPINKQHIHEILNAKDKGLKPRHYWQQDGPGPQRFELVDYYDEIQGMYIKKLQPIRSVHRTSSGSQIMTTPMHRTFSGTQILHRTNSGLQEIMEATEATDEDETYGKDFRNNVNVPVIPKMKAKPVVVEKTTTQSNEQERKIKQHKKKDRSKSAKKFHAPPPPTEEEINQQIKEKEDNEQKRSKARHALKRALSAKGKPVSLERTNSKNEKIDVKFANVKRLIVETSEENDNSQLQDQNKGNETNFESKLDESDKNEKMELQNNVTQNDTVNTKNANDKFSKSNIKRFSSFSSNDSFSSIGSSIRAQRGDVSLTSGELTSLSSQADPDTDDFATDIEGPAKEVYLKKVMQKRMRRNVDSGFDSESSEISSHGPHTTYTSDDSAFHDTLDKVKSKKFHNHTRPDPFTKVDISSTPQIYEKAFCLTGINSSVVSRVDDFPEMEVEYLPDKDVLPVLPEDEYRPTSSLSRIIEVSSASPEQTKDMEIDQEQLVRANSNTTNEGQQFKSVVGRPKTPINSRPKTPGLPKNMFGPNVMTSRGPNVMASNKPTDASRRYRELVKKGVPLRVSEISANNTEISKNQNNSDERESMKGMEDSHLFDNLDSQGFFQNEKSRKLIPGRTPSGMTRKSRRDQERKANRPKLNKLTLDDIIKEIPEDKSPSPGQKSPRVNFLSPTHSNNNAFNDSCSNISESEVAMLNQPQSEESETASVKNNSSVSNSNPPVVLPQNQPAVVVDAELYIDRIYSQKQTPEHQMVHPPLLDPDFDSPLLPNNNKTMPSLVPETRPFDVSSYDGNVQQDEGVSVDVPLRNGMTDKHVENCRKLTSSLHLVAFNDLLPATQEGFDMMKLKLRQAGQLGDVGSQILDIVHKCWLNDTPPTSFDLVMQLMDPVTETEL